MNQRLMLCLSIVLCLPIPGAALAGGKPVTSQEDNTNAPQGALAPRYRVSGARSSATLATEVHCTNLDAATINVYVDFYDFDASHACATSSAIPSGGTRTFATADTASFAEDAICTSAPSIGQGSANIATSTIGAKFICSAEVVSRADDPPTTLGALDIWPGN